MRSDYKFDEESRAYSRDKQRKRRERLQELPSDFKKDDREMTMDMFDHRCGYCDAYEEDVKLEMDHFIDAFNDDCPGTVVGNMIPACRPCNRSKGSQAPEEFLSKERFDTTQRKLNCLGAWWLPGGKD